MRWRRSAGAAAFAIAVIVLLLALRALAGAITAGHLADVSAQTLATLRADQPLWHWTFRSADDLVAGRAFGAAQLVTDRGELAITSDDGSQFELGLPLTRPADIQHWSRLQVSGSASAAGELGVIYQHSTTAACVTPHVVAIPQGDFTLVIDLAAMSWRPSNGGACAATASADMLRLRVQIPAGASVRLDRGALLRAPGAAPAPANAGGFALPADSQHTQQIIDRYAALDIAAPLIRLPAGASAETMLTLRDQLQRRWPAALLLADGAALPALTLSRSRRGAGVIGWVFFGLYAAGLAWMSLRPAPVGHAARIAEVGGLLFGLLWLTAGLQWGQSTSDPLSSMPAALAFVAAVSYAALTTWRQRSRGWQWWPRWHDVWPALLPLLPATALWLAFGHALQGVSLRGALVYLLWACLQQWLMLVVVMGRLGAIVPSNGTMIVLTATTFALLHTPNGALMQLCLLAECWWAWCFVRRPKLLPIAVAHAACAVLLQAGLTGSLLRSLEVSARFFH